MSIQSTLTLTIEVIFNLFIALMIFDLINGLWIVPLPLMISIAQPQIVSSPTPSVLIPQFEPISNPWELELEPQQVTVIASQIEQLPDPWKLDVETPTPSTETQPVILTWTTLRLLPPVKEVQPKVSRKTQKATSTKKPKSAPFVSPRKPGRPKKAA